MDEARWKECIEFHGHECPGLAIGYRASEIAEEFFGRKLSPKSDEMIVCVTENDACAVDAVQVMTGCTVGKGNLVFRPTGKMAFSFFGRDDEKALRVVLNSEVLPEGREERKRWILEGPVEGVFKVGAPAFKVPEKARLFRNEICEVCGEAAPEHKMRIQEGKVVCQDCFGEYDRGW